VLFRGFYYLIPVDIITYLFIYLDDLVFGADDTEPSVEEEEVPAETARRF
jgi:hypothetical protein